MLSNYILKGISRSNNSINLLDNNFLPYALGIIPDKNIYLNALSNYYFYNDNYKKQINTLFKALKLSPTNKYLKVNLGYCSSFIFDKENCEFLLYKIEQSNIDNIQIRMLKINILLRLNPQKGKSLVHSKFINPIVKPNIKQNRKKPILFFHIPKCGGTTIKKLLGKYYYKNFSNIQPGYENYYLLKYCIKEIPHQFPFLSSSHLDVNQLNIPENIFYEFTIIRDPVKRTMSAFRQTYGNIKSGYLMKVIPKYGGNWYYWGIKNYLDWLQKTPEIHVNRQLSTFSPALNPIEAKNKLRNLDRILFLEDGFNGITSLFNDLNLPFNENIGTKKHNKSPKNISINQNHINKAEKILADEISLINDVKVI